jgi:hypothetical protein
MSEIDREELRGLLEEATPGPWLYDNQGGKTDEFELFYQDLSYTNGPVIASLKGREEDAQLIALAPTLAAAYLDLLERAIAAEKRADRAEAEVERLKTAPVICGLPYESTDENPLPCKYGCKADESCRAIYLSERHARTALKEPSHD